MKRVAAALAATLASVALFRLAAPAQACSATAPLAEDGLLPAPGATDVPLNTRVMVRLHGDGALGTYRVVLRAPDGTEVASSSRQVSAGFETRATFVTPAAPLAPHTTYEVLDNLGGELALLGSFVTGETSDTTPPQLQADFQQTVGHVSCSGGGDCCGVYDANTYEIHWPAATDASPVIYELVSAQYPEDHVETVRTFVIGEDLCYAQTPADGPNHDLAHGGYLTFRAVDLAGNVATPATVYAADECGRPPACDGGWRTDADAGVPDAGHLPYCDGGYFEAEGNDERVGCSIGVGGSSSGGTYAVGVGLLALALVVIVRRRRE